jgi:hypothetical protein
VICDFKDYVDPVTGLNTFRIPNRDGWNGRAGGNENDSGQKKDGDNRTDDDGVFGYW